MESKITLCLFIFGISQVSASVLPKWSDIFSSLKPYQDEETLMLHEEDGEPRVGFVQLPTSGFNATVNLSGPIILGLGIASSLLLYMFFEAFMRPDYHPYYSRY